MPGNEERVIDAHGFDLAAIGHHRGGDRAVSPGEQVAAELGRIDQADIGSILAANEDHPEVGAVGGGLIPDGRRSAFG